MIVSEDYVLGGPTSTYGWPHVVSFKQNPDIVPGRAALGLCGRRTWTYNFAGACLPWHYSATVCAECRAVALGPQKKHQP